MDRTSETVAAPPYLLPIQEVASRLVTSLDIGLSEAEVERRRKIHGWNEIRQRESSILSIILQKFTSILTLILLAAIAISIFYGQVADAVIIGVVVVFDISFGVLYELYSKYKIDLIKKQVPRITEVLRGGKPFVIPVRDLVPGDLCVVRQGERIPADLRLAAVRGLSINESILTGEPGDVEKVSAALHAEAVLGDQRNMAFGGTLVTAGSARGIVVATGPASVIGALAERVVEAGAQPTPLERHLRRLGGVLGVGLILISGLLFVGGVLRGEAPETMFRQALTLIVSAIPEDLTLILTITLAIGARRLLGRGGIVRQLTAAETLGDATVVCADKTGTLTTGEITLARVEGVAETWGPPAQHPNNRSARERPMDRPPAFVHHALLAALAGTDTVQIVREGASPRGSSLERALTEAAQERNIPLPAIRRAYPLFDTLAFQPVQRYRASLHGDPSLPDPVAFVVGAPDTLLPRCVAVSRGKQSLRLTASLRRQLLERAAFLARKGEHILLVALRHLPRPQRSITSADVTDLTFLALLVFRDPLRADAKAAVGHLQRAGVRVLLLTGDHRGTAETVARETGILRPGGRVLEGSTVGGMNDALLGDALASADVIARVDPFQKERIVQVLQERGDIVGMIGDGVNDAVALRRADLGVAVGTGTDVAKDAADLVLTDASIATLTAAVHEGRRIRETVRTVLSFLFSTNVTEVLAIFAALLLGLPLPFLPAMLLWINIVTDGTADIALALEPASSRPGDPTPGKRRSIFRRSDPLTILLTSVALFVPTMLVYASVLDVTYGDVATARTMAFVTLASAQLFVAFSYRSLDRPTLRLHPFSNPWLIGAVLLSFSLLVAAVTVPSLRDLLGAVPLTPAQWVLAIAAAMLGAVSAELRKLFVPTPVSPSGADRHAHGFLRPGVHASVPAIPQ